MVFPFFSLPPELRARIFKNLLQITTNSRGKRECSTEILRASKQCHAEGQSILHGVNEIRINVALELSLGSAYALSMYDTSLEIAVAGSNISSDLDKPAPKNVFEMAARWPTYVRKAKKLRLSVRVDGISGSKQLEWLVDHPNASLFVLAPVNANEVFAKLSQLVFTLAYAAEACKELRVDFSTNALASSGATALEVDRLLAGTAAFAHVSKCEVRLSGSTSAGASLRALILGLTPMRSGKPVTRVFELVRETERTLALVLAGGRRGAAWGPLVLLNTSYQDAMKAIERRLGGDALRGCYLPFGGSTALDDLMLSLETFMTMPETKRMLSLDEAGLMGAVVLCSRR